MDEVVLRTYKPSTESVSAIWIRISWGGGPIDPAGTRAE